MMTDIITKPVPDSSYEVARRNLEDLDKLENQTSGTFQNRAGKVITPIPVVNDRLESLTSSLESLEQEFVAGIASTGYFPVAGSFEAGGIIIARNQYLQLTTTVGSDLAGGYTWGGVIPEGGLVIPAGSTPSSTGGQSANAWVWRSDATVRSDLANGTADVGGQTAQSIADLRGDLADPTGADLVTAKIPTLNAIARSLQWAFRNQPKLNVFNFMTDAEIADIQSGSPTIDVTAKVENALVHAKTFYLLGGFESSGGVEIYFPAGQYLVQRVLRRSGVSIAGDGSRNTVFIAASRTAPTGQDPVYGLFEIESGPVSASNLRGICICGSSTPTGTTAVNADQWGIYSRAKWNAAFTQGGLWHSGYEDVWVRGFNYGEWSRAGYTNAHSRLPNQFITYNKMTVHVCAGGEARRFTGQHGQISVSNGDSGALDSLVAALVIKCDWDPSPAQVASATNGESVSDVAGSGNAVRTPELIQFNNGSGIQRANKGCFIRNTRGISFDNCWFESLGGSFELVTNGGAYVTNSRFANAADGSRFSTPAAGTGYIVKHGTNTNFEFGAGNDIAGVRDQFVDSALNMANILRDKHYFSSRVTDGKFNVASPATLTASSAGVVDVKGLNYIYLRAYQANLSVPITTISSMLVPSDILTIRAWTGPITFSNSGGNLKIGSGGRQSVTIPENGYITFMRVHGFSDVEWVMQSYNEHYSDTLPSAGYFSRGHKIWKNNPNPSDSAGWICTTAGIAGSTAVFSAMPSRALDSFTVATLPSASANTRQSIYVSDMTGGAGPAYSNGTNWARYSDNTTVS